MTKERFTTPVGRLVQGSVDEPQTKDAQGNLRTVKTGPNAGQPNPQFFIAVAFAKNEPVDPATGRRPFDDFYGTLVRKAAEDFPNLFPNAPRGDYTCVHPQFAYKVIDGDGVDQNGHPHTNKEGFAGHWVVRFASAYPPRCFYAGRYAANEQIQEKGAIKRGYYVRVSGTAEGNANAQRPGLYVNLDMVELAAYGPEIVSGPDASQAFANGSAALPPGASPTPLTPPAPAPGGPATPPAPIAPPIAAPAPPPPLAGPQRPTDPSHIHAAGTPQEQWWINGAWQPAALPLPAPVAAPPLPVVASPAPGSPPPPYTGYMAPPVPPTPPTPGAPAVNPAPPVPGPVPSPIASPGNVLPPAPPAPVAPPAAGPTMLPAAGGATYAQMIAAGWTDETLRAHGMMA